MMPAVLQLVRMPILRHTQTHRDTQGIVVRTRYHPHPKCPLQRGAKPNQKAKKISQRCMWSPWDPHNRTMSTTPAFMQTSYSLHRTHTISFASCMEQIMCCMEQIMCCMEQIMCCMEQIMCAASKCAKCLQEKRLHRCWAPWKFCCAELHQLSWCSWLGNRPSRCDPQQQVFDPDCAQPPSGVAADVAGHLAAVKTQVLPLQVLPCSYSHLR